MISFTACAERALRRWPSASWSSAASWGSLFASLRLGPRWGALERTGGNVSRAAGRCGMTRAALQRILRQLEIDATRFRGR